MSVNLVEKLNLNPKDASWITTTYHQEEWISKESFPKKNAMTKLAIDSFKRLLNPKYDWTLEAFRVERGQFPAMEAMIFSPQPPSVEHEVPVRVKKGGEYVTETRPKLFLDLAKAINPDVFPNPAKKTHYQKYRQSPSGLTLDGVSVFPFLNLEGHLQQALNPDPQYDPFANHFYIPYVFVRALPLFSLDPQYSSSEPVGEHRKLLYVSVPLKDVRPLIKAAILDRKVEKAEKLVHLEEVRCNIEQDLARTNGLIDQLSPDYVALEVLTYQGYLKGLTGNNRLALSAGQTQAV